MNYNENQNFYENNKSKENKYKSVYEGNEIKKSFKKRNEPYKIVLAEIDKEVHLQTQLMFLKYYSYDGKGVELYSAYSFSEVKSYITKHPETAVILLNLDIDDNDEGYNLIKYIRETLKNQDVRIILQSAESEIITNEDIIPKYNISDYKQTDKLAIAEIFISITTALSAYRDRKIKDVLFKEVHHRVKNNLQIITSMLNLQSRYIKSSEFVSVYKESVNRIQAISLIHRKLYEDENIAQLDFADYVSSLLRNIFHNYSISQDRIMLNADVERMLIDIDVAIPCGLVINEIVSNSLKYAFLPEQKGSVSLRFYFENGYYYLLIEDTGIGLPKSINFEDPKSLGLLLISMLVEQLEGTIEIDRDNGTTYKIIFPELE